ncbi:MAG: cytochrome c biogenesis protein CcsA [Verrucomicrobiota bacterium]
MELDRLLLWLATLCFLGGAVMVLPMLRGTQAHRSRVNLAVMLVGFLAICGNLWLRGEAQGRCPITDLSEVLVFVSWSCGLFYFLFGVSYQLSLLGLFTAPLSVLLQGLALLLWQPMPETAHPAHDYWLELHAALSLLSFGALALAGTAAWMFLLQDRLLKKRRLEDLSTALPPIRLLGGALFRLVAAGFAILTIGIGSAYFMVATPSPAKLGLAYFVWGTYGVLLVLYLFADLAARKFALATAFAALFSLLSLGVVAR